MTIEIQHRISESDPRHLVAYAFVRGQSFTHCGKTWEEAETGLVENIKRVFSTPVPPAKQVSIELPGEAEMEVLF